jgi:nucleotide-binding universal stress UspA family protein
MASKKILVGIDGSEGSYKAAALASTIASRTEGTVTLLFVVPDSGPYSDRFITKSTYTNEDEVLAGQKLIRAKEILDKNRVPNNTEIAMGNPAKVILNRSKDFDMIVLGTKGENQAIEFLMGSISHRVAQHTTVPLILVP